MGPQGFLKAPKLGQKKAMPNLPFMGLVQSVGFGGQLLCSAMHMTKEFHAKIATNAYLTELLSRSYYFRGS